MKAGIALATVIGALLIPSSGAPDNARLQREISMLQRHVTQLRGQVAKLRHDAYCENGIINELDRRITALEQGPPPRPTNGVPGPTPARGC